MSWLLNYYMPNSQHDCHGLHLVSAAMGQPSDGHAASLPDNHLFHGKSLPSDTGLISGHSALGRGSRMGVKLTATAVRVAGKTGHKTRQRER